MPFTAFTFGDPAPNPAQISLVACGVLVPVQGLAINTNPSANTPPVWPNFTFAGGVTGVAYSEQFDLYPASTPTTFSVVGGTLPTGLSLSNLTNDQGKISGTPTAAGTYSFTLRATNSYGTADKAFSITIAAASGGGSGGAWTFAA